VTLPVALAVVAVWVLVGVVVVLVFGRFLARQRDLDELARQQRIRDRINAGR
jgi:HAMP domain-containing protein